MFNKDEVLKFSMDALHLLDLKNLLKPNTIIDGRVVQEALSLIQIPESIMQTTTSFERYCFLRHAIEFFSDVSTAGSAIDEHHIEKIDSGYTAYSAIALISK